MPTSLAAEQESDRREVDEQNDDEQGERRSKDATHQPELTHPERQPVPARAAGGRQTRFLRTASVCSHMALRSVSKILRHRLAVVVPRPHKKTPGSSACETARTRRSELVPERACPESLPSRRKATSGGSAVAGASRCGTCPRPGKSSTRPFPLGMVLARACIRSGTVPPARAAYPRRRRRRVSAPGCAASHRPPGRHRASGWLAPVPWPASATLR